jgi:leader peptidase (prepilin peptidase)/N-methyltransferase
MTPAWAFGVAVLGALAGPLARGRIFHHSVPRGDADDPDEWRRSCPHCGRALVPGVVALLPPSGRCPACAARVGPPPFVVEAVLAAVFGLLAWRFPPSWTLVALCWVAAIGVALFFVDLAVHRLPDQLTYAAAAGALVALTIGAVTTGAPGRLIGAVLGGLGLAAFYIGLVLLYPAGMGLGDAKLALSLGAVLGWFGWVVVVFGGAAGFLLAGLTAVVLLALRRVGRKSHLAHGPFMLLGALLTLVLLPL